MEVWLNGAFVSHEEAKLSVFDAGFQHGVGLFETMAARNGTVFRGPAHMARLEQSARDLLLTTRLRTDPLLDAVEMTLERNGLADARVRLTLTGGDMASGPGESGQVDPSILIMAQPPTEYPDRFFTDGVNAIVADGRVNPFDPDAGHKTLNYWSRIRTLQIAAGKQAGEAIWFTVTNHLAGGSVSNAFVVKDGVMHTPFVRGEEAEGAVPAGILPGTTRACVIECAEGAGIEVQRSMLDIEAVLGADELFLTNASWGVLPVVGVEAHVIAEGEVGAITRTMREAWLDCVADETR